MNPFIPTQTAFVYPSASTDFSSPTSLTTSWVGLRIRDDSSASDSSSSSTTKKTTTSKCTDSQRCQTGQDTNALTIALAVTIPCVVFLSVIGYFIFRSYKKGKQEAKDDDDPDFYGETTILPDYPRKEAGPDDDSLYSSGQNPFSTDNTRYPSAAIQAYGNNQQYQPRNFSRGAPSMNTTQTDGYYESFTLPYQHTMGSKHSLDSFAKEIGSEYNAYPASRPQSPYVSAHSSTVNLNQPLQQQDSRMRNVTEKSTNSYEGETTESPYSYNEAKINNDDSLDDDDVDEPIRRGEDVFADPSQLHHYQDVDDKRLSDMSYLEDEPEHLNTTTDTVLRHEVPEDDYVQSEQPVKKGVKFDAKEDDEDDEDIKRMKSVYKVYFDRENSVKKPGNVLSASGLDDAPPLPNVNVDIHDDEEQQDEVRELQEPPTNLLSVGKPGQEKKHRVVSSIYSTVPLQFDQHAPQQRQQLDPSYHPQQQQQQQQQQQYQQQQHQQQYQNYPLQQHQYQQQQYQPPVPQNIYKPPSRYGSPSASPRLQPQYSGQPVELPPLQTVPTPNKIEYADIVTNTDYAPTKSLTAGTRPPDIAVRPFNPLHHSDQIFSPTSPNTPSSAQFQPPDAQARDALPPSPHHLRQSIVMMDPVGIGKEKIYRPAGAFSQMNSASSSRAGSLTSQSAYAPPQGSSDGELLPRSGSKADLRTQLGSSENYNFM